MTSGRRRSHVALLRGINVGRAKRIAMADLRALMERLGFAAVRTILASGNIAFTGGKGTPEQVAATIEGALEGAVGVKARVIVLAPEQLDAIVADNTLEGLADNPSRMLVAVPYSGDLLARLEPLLQDDWAPEGFAIGSRAAYVWCPEGVIDSPLWARIEKVLGKEVTTRNWATINKLHALTMPEGDR